MKKKRNKKLLIPLFICIPLFIVCLLFLLSPQKVDNYLFHNVEISNFHGAYGIDVSFNIENNTDENLSDVTINITYDLEENFFVNIKETHTISLVENLNVGDNEINFSHEKTDFGDYEGEIKSITITIDGETYEVKQKSIMGQKNWLCVGGCVIGFIGSAVSFVVWLNSNKAFVNPAEERLKTFEERIKEAFKPAEPVEKKPERIVCHYCKCKYDAENHSKCPNCGAPPEPKD